MSLQDFDFQNSFSYFSVSQFPQSGNNWLDQDEQNHDFSDIFNDRELILDSNSEDNFNYKLPWPTIMTNHFIAPSQDDSPIKNCSEIELNSIEFALVNKFQKSQKENEQKKIRSEFYKTRKNAIGCACKLTKCLRRYCPCFANGGVCVPDCLCSNCMNSDKFKKERAVIIEKTKKITKNSFTKKIVKTKTGRLINTEGCQCKSGCLSGKCACSKNGIGCSPICRCLSCQNKFTPLTKQEVLENYRACIRTRDKIILKDLDKSNSKSGISFASLLPQNRKVYKDKLQNSTQENFQFKDNEILDQYLVYENQEFLFSDISR